MLIDNGNGTFSMYAPQVGTPGADDNLPLPELMLPVLEQYITFRAFSDESTVNHNPERAAQALSEFKDALAV